MSLKPKMRIFAAQICLTGFLGIVAALGVAGAASAPFTGPHPHTVCENCHMKGETQVSGSTSVGPPRKKVCVDCHAGVLQAPRGVQPGLASAQSGHVLSNGLAKRIAPLGGGSFDQLECLSCHVPHYQGQAKLLRLNRDAAAMNHGSAKFDPATLLCFTCHPVAGEVRGVGTHYVRHPVGIPVTKPGRVLDFSKLPPLADVNGTPVISCITCHYPHASTNSFLLRWSRAELSSACLQCHPEVAPGPTGPIVRR